MTTPATTLRLADVPMQACPQCGAPATQLVPVRDGIGQITGIRFSHALGAHDRPHTWTDTGYAGMLVEPASVNNGAGAVEPPPISPGPDRPQRRPSPPAVAGEPAPPTRPELPPAGPAKRRRLRPIGLTEERVPLAKGGYLLVDVLADPWDLPEEQFTLIREVLRLCREFKAAHPEGGEP